MTLSIFEIPEVLESIAKCMDSFDLTVCLRVCKTWHEGFLVHLWRNVHVYDLDYCHIRKRMQHPELFAEEDKDKSEAGKDLYGRHAIHNYSHLIRSFRVESLASLDDLGPNCVHLEELCIGNNPSYSLQPVTMPQYKPWQPHLTSRPSNVNSSAGWLTILALNPNLKVVHNCYGQSVDGPFIDGLCRLQYLKTVVLRMSDLTLCVKLICESHSLKKLRVLPWLDDSEDTIGELSDAVGAKIAGRILHGQPVPSLRHLELSGHTALELIHLCPELDHLCFSHIHISETYQALAAILARSCRSLKRLTILYGDADTGLELALESCPLGLQFLRYTGQSVQVPVIETLVRRHGLTLQEFFHNGYLPDARFANFGRNAQGEMVIVRAPEPAVDPEQEIKERLISMLTGSCPQLRVFACLSYQLDIQQLLGVAWSVSSQLVELRLAFKGLFSLNKDARAERLDRFYAQLGQCHHLKILDLSVDDGFCWSLKSGLRQLSTLTRLQEVVTQNNEGRQRAMIARRHKHLGLPPTVDAQGNALIKTTRADVEWMVDHWPRLRRLVGVVEDAEESELLWSALLNERPWLQDRHISRG